MLSGTGARSLTELIFSAASKLLVERTVGLFCMSHQYNAWEHPEMVALLHTDLDLYVG